MLPESRKNLAKNLFPYLIITLYLLEFLNWRELLSSLNQYNQRDIPDTNIFQDRLYIT